jgi:HSP20 family molecular chaperone IbpA
MTSTLPVHRRGHTLLPEFADFFSAFPSFALRPAFDSRVIRLEDEMKDGRYEVHAEIPGVDPAKDVDVTVRDGQLTIKAERTERSESSGRSEFSYGSFVRTIGLPKGADESDITASYDKGILTVSVAVSDTQPAEKHIEITGSE